MSDIGDFLDKVPPQDLEAERCVLGSILFLNEAMEDVESLLAVQCFYADAHRRIFQAMHAMLSSGRMAVDAVTLRDELTKRSELELIGGVPYILQLCEIVPHAAHAEYYAKIVREKWLQRSLIEACTESLKEAYHGQCDMMDLLTAAEDRIRKITDQSKDADGLVTLDQATTQMHKEMVAARSGDVSDVGVRLPIHYPSLAHHLPYLSAGDVTVIAATTKTGKTTLWMNLIRPILEAGEPVLVFSEEMKAVELARKYHAMYSRVEGRHMKSGVVFDNPLNMARISEASETIRTHKLYIHDTSQMPLCELKRMVRKAVKRLGIKLVVVDHIGLIQSSQAARYQDDTARVKATSNALKSLAMHHDIPILVLSQLTKAVEQRPDKRPNVGDLKDTGDIAQDANNILLMHRPSKYDKEDRPGEVDIKIAAVRDGPTGDITLRYTMEFDLFEDDGLTYPNDF